MNGDTLDMEEVTVELTDTELEAIEERAFENHRGNEQAAMRDLLDEWLKRQE